MVGTTSPVSSTADYGSIPDLVEIQLVLFCETFVVSSGRPYGRESGRVSKLIKVSGQAWCGPLLNQVASGMPIVYRYRRIRPIVACRPRYICFYVYDRKHKP